MVIGTYEIAGAPVGVSGSFLGGCYYARARDRRQKPRKTHKNPYFKVIIKGNSNNSGNENSNGKNKSVVKYHY